MPKITALIPQSRRPQTYNLFLDGNYAFSLSLDLIIKLKLSSGQILSPVQLNDLLYQVYFEKLWRLALNYLSFRPRSSFEVRRKLENYLFQSSFGYSEKIDSATLVSALITKLQTHQFLDDFKFTLWFLENRLNFKLKSRRELTQELIQKGIDQALINQALSQLHYNETEILKRLLAKKINHYSSSRQLLNYLLRRGFNLDIIRQTAPFLFD